MLPKAWAAFFITEGGAVMGPTVLIIRTAICAVCGVAIGIIGIILAKLLLKQRNLEYVNSKKTDVLLSLAMAVPGGAVGAFTSGVALPICGLLLLCICVCISYADTYARVIPNQTVLAILVLGLAFGIPTLCGVENFLKFNIVQSLIGFVVCFIVFALPGLFGKKVGAGDIKLAAATGFFLGIYYALIAVVVMGVLVIVYGIFQRKLPLLSYMKTEIPMGPFITVGLMAAFILTYALPIK